MRTYFKLTLLLFITAFTFQSCQDNDDIPPPASLEIQDFIWKGMNQYYLWQADVPNLADDRFADQTALNTFLSGYPVPEDLFGALKVSSSIDKFSWIVDDYLELEGSLQGTTKNNGVDFGLSYKPGSSTEIYGFVRYIIANSNASTKNIKRGDFFTAVNGTQLTLSNYQSLLFGSNENYILNLADYNGTTIVGNGKSVDLAKTVLTENPILINKVITSGSHKIGYLMYNGFYANFDTQLNEAFASLKSQGATDLVLDLRYNGGGSVQTATRLASMITGQFTGKVFAKQQWNKKINDYFEAESPEALYNYFTDKIGGNAINSLNLTKVYILTSASSASASELVINGLEPHINVIQIGDVTVGKNVGSVTLYDSPTFGAENRNPKHRYAMQPIVLKIVNSVGFGDYFNGLQPDFLVKETLSTLGVLGDSSEPLLSTAIGKITGASRMMKQSPGKEFDFFTDSKSILGIQNQMYLEKAPEGLLRALE
ncbi:C-terminal processing protease CtpA/Prc, contains a PDZ domain [Flavobacterium fryxellicola]|uniref:Peptidase S41 n=1 Tax=Flavobacterium fryxellicola TaxID=249352 RepID=A0A167XZJ2_9FLAO|nr:S41 family peptidase [Flavobacterium fryxellicola]OAB28859.1 peptidase S41 [Flavobacterium fryxellicola]SHN60959.1 C-terminal processing protease CtpA/Prc, contains a PDZ domain [Flavobacterium fryxellicola]